MILWWIDLHFVAQECYKPLEIIIYKDSHCVWFVIIVKFNIKNFGLKTWHESVYAPAL